MELINNRYKLVEEIGRGGMGVVFKAYDLLKQNLPVALKIIRKEILTRKNQEVLRRFKNEYKVMTRLKHPNLVRVYDFARDSKNDNYFITMEYLQGDTLENILKERKKLELDEGLDIFVEVLRAIEFMHSRDIIYRDIKPSNIIINFQKKKLEVKLLDFGLSDLGEAEKGKVKGSALYMSPEILNKEELDYRLDIFALGILLYEILNGKYIFEREDFSSVKSMIDNLNNLKLEITTFTSVFKDQRIRDLIEKMIAYRKEDRFLYASRIIEAINQKFQKKYELETKESKHAYLYGANYVPRKGELEFLQEQLFNNEKKVIILKGNYGIGKTSLFKEFKKFCQLEPGVLFFKGTCKFKKLFAPFSEIIENLYTRIDQKLIEKYHDLFAYFNIIFSEQKTLFLSSDSLVKKISKFLLDCALYFETMMGYQDGEFKGLVIFLENLQVIDELSSTLVQELISILAYQLKEKKKNYLIKIYGALREEERYRIDSMDQFLSKRDRVRYYNLKPFTSAEILKYFNNIFGSRYIKQKRLTASSNHIHQNIGGNPAILNEFLKKVIEENTIDKVNSYWFLNTDIKDVAVPHNIYAINKNRLNRLTLLEEEKALLYLLSAYDRSLTISFLEYLLEDFIEIDLATFLDKCIDLEIIKSKKKQEILFYEINDKILAQVIEENFGYFKDEIYYNLAAKTEKYYFATLEDPILEKQFIQEVGDFYFYLQNTTNVNIIMKIFYYNMELAQIFYKKHAHKMSLLYLNKLLDYYNGLKLKEFKNGIRIYLKNYYFSINLLRAQILEFTGNWKRAEVVNLKMISLLEENVINQGRFLAKYLVNYSSLLIKKSMYDQALYNLFIALQYFMDLEMKQEQADCLKYIGMIHYNKAEYDKARKFYFKSLKIQKKLANEDGITKISFYLGKIYSKQGQYDLAENMIRKRYDYTKKIQDDSELAIALGSLGIIYMMQKEYQKAVAYFEKQLPILKKTNDKKELARVFGNLGVVYRNLGNYKSSEKYLNKNIYFTREIEDQKGLALALNSLGTLHFDFGKRGSLKLFKKALEIAGKIEDQWLLANINYNLGLYYKDKAKYDQALKFYQRAIDISISLKENSFLALYYYSLANLYYLTKKYARSLECLQKSSSYSLDVKNNFLMFKNMILRYKINFNQTKSLKEKEQIFNKIFDIGNSVEDLKLKAYVYYQLSFLSIFIYDEENCFKNKALEFYQKLYKETSKKEYQKKIVELENIKHS